MGDAADPENYVGPEGDAATACLTGIVLEGKYRVGRVVAEGGFSIIYTAEHLALGIRVAIKTLKSAARRGEPEEWLARFREEARLVARILHPNVVRVFDTGVYRPAGSATFSVPWMVLEWLDGETLQEHLAARRGAGGRSPSECLPWIRALFSAVAAAHRAGVAHRDIKPSNILLTSSGTALEPKLLDFGIAKVMTGESRASSGETATDSDFRAFSKHYAAPEQLAGARTGPWTDVHGLGLLVTELLTDHSPYASDDPALLGELIFSAERPSVRRFGTGIGPWEPILQRMLARRSQDRAQDLNAVLSELEATVTQATAAWTPCPGQAQSSVLDAETGSRTRTLVPTSRPPEVPPKPRRPLWLLAMGGLLVLAVAMQAARAVQEPLEKRAPAVAPSSQSVVSKAPERDPQSKVASALPVPQAVNSAARVEPSPASQPAVESKPKQSRPSKPLPVPSRQETEPLRVAPLDGSRPAVTYTLE